MLGNPHWTSRRKRSIRVSLEATRISSELARGPPRETNGSLRSSTMPPPSVSLGNAARRGSGSHLPGWKTSSGSLPIRFQPTRSGSSHQGSPWGNLRRSSQPCHPYASSVLDPDFMSYRNRNKVGPSYRFNGSCSCRIPVFRGRISTRTRHRILTLFML